jgi:hypothetical protein
MKRILYKIGILTCLSFIVLACNTKYDIFVEPNAVMELEKTTVDVLEPVYIKNLGSGETFSFWTGDEGHDFSKIAVAKNSGLPPNRGLDFEYTYLRSGTYTITLLASSFDEVSGKYIQRSNTVQITVKPGNNGNNFTSFAIDNAFAGYSPEGTINGNLITIPIGFINRASGIDDKAYASLINRRPPLFSVNSSSAKVYSEDGTLLQGRGDDNYKLNLIDETTLDPIVKKFSVVQDGLSHEYSVAALFYPEISGLSVLGFTAKAYSKNGLTSVPENEIKQLQLAYPNQTFYGVFIAGAKPDKLKSAILKFTAAKGVTVHLKSTGEEIISGTTPVDITTPPIDFEIRRSVNGFSIASEFKIYTTVF